MTYIIFGEYIRCTLLLLRPKDNDTAIRFPDIRIHLVCKWCGKALIDHDYMSVLTYNFCKSRSIDRKGIHIIAIRKLTAFRRRLCILLDDGDQWQVAIWIFYQFAVRSKIFRRSYKLCLCAKSDNVNETYL